MIYGRNLDSNNPIRGNIFINKRGVYKESITFRELYLGKSMKDVPRLKWISKYGSVTFNIMGAEFPDGGMNEAGLFFEEMTLLETQYPTDYSQPTIHMEQWIQYVLDNFATVEEVLENAKSISIDGWNWHYFVADSSGQSAVIEFLNGQATITSGDELKTALLCNSTYSEEQRKLMKYSETGSLDSLGKDKRFHYGRKAMEEFSESGVLSAVDYGFEILKSLTPEPYSTTQLSKIYDVGNMIVYYRTTVDSDIKSIDLKCFDFSCSDPMKMLDVNVGSAGNVTKYFSDYSFQENHKMIEESVLIFVENPEVKAYLENEGSKYQDIIKTMAGFPELTHCKEE